MIKPPWSWIIAIALVTLILYTVLRLASLESGDCSMGGEHTETVTQAVEPSAEATTSPGAGRQSIEIHQKGPEVHFHDRTSGLKVAVPVADWYAAWRRLEHAEVGKGEFTYFDAKEQTRLRVTTAWNSNLADMISLYARISIEKVERTNDVYKALQSFMRRATGGK
jgi:hypothetical protein